MNEKLVANPVKDHDVEVVYNALCHTKQRYWDRVDKLTKLQRHKNRQSVALTLAMMSGAWVTKGTNAAQRADEVSAKLRNINRAIERAEDVLEKAKRDMELALLEVDEVRLIVRLMEIEIGRLPDAGH